MNHNPMMGVVALVKGMTAIAIMAVLLLPHESFTIMRLFIIAAVGLVVELCYWLALISEPKLHQYREKMADFLTLMVHVTTFGCCALVLTQKWLF